MRKLAQGDSHSGSREAWLGGCTGVFWNPRRSPTQNTWKQQLIKQQQQTQKRNQKCTEQHGGGARAPRVGCTFLLTCLSLKRKNYVSFDIFAKEKPNFDLFVFFFSGGSPWISENLLIRCSGYRNTEKTKMVQNGPEKWEPPKTVQNLKFPISPSASTKMLCF